MLNPVGIDRISIKLCLGNFCALPTMANYAYNIVIALFNLLFVAVQFLHCLAGS
ncbi:hypothetical protein HD_0608 [[Haemophilus] ducreyi 35000HP]|uniref:Uncharacterized protein n=1 Tax=Haemophilus ducreyi (strain 35000HP / ATCC 700724) TaxID=233412 RepID=Q7VNE1_HAEDU|nr:hypothetical protein HD_0608 [[Haemophilus] ducreyi 35000HP]